MVGYRSPTSTNDNMIFMYFRRYIRRIYYIHFINKKKKKPCALFANKASVFPLHSIFRNRNYVKKKVSIFFSLSVEFFQEFVSSALMHDVS